MQFYDLKSTSFFLCGLVLVKMLSRVEVKTRYRHLSFELVNDGHTNLNDFFADGFEHFAIKMAHLINMKKSMRVKFILSGSFLESGVFKDFYDCEDFCEYVHHFIHSNDDLWIDESTDVKQFYTSNVAEYFGEYVSENLQSVENSALDEIFDLIVYVYDGDDDDDLLSSS